MFKKSTLASVYDQASSTHQGLRIKKFKLSCACVALTWVGRSPW